MEEEVLVGAQKSGSGGCCCSDYIHDGGIIESLHPIEVRTRIRMQTAQHSTVDVHTNVPEGVIRVVAGMGIRTTGKHDEYRY